MSINIDLGVSVVTAYDADGFPSQGADFLGEEKAGVAPGEQLHPFGLMGRPRDPDVDSTGTPTLGATMMRLIEGNEEHAIALGDPRATPKLPKVEKGSAGVYADTGAAVLPFVLLSGKDGTFQIYVPYGSSPATAATIAIDLSTPGAESIQIVHGAGMRLTMTAGATNPVLLVNRTGDAYVQVDDVGITLNGNLQATGALAVGVGVPPPQPVARAAEIVAREAAQDVFNAAVATALNGPQGVPPVPVMTTGAMTYVPPTPLLPTVTAQHLSTT